MTSRLLGGQWLSWIRRRAQAEKSDAKEMMGHGHGRGNGTGQGRSPGRGRNVDARPGMKRQARGVKQYGQVRLRSHDDPKAARSGERWSTGGRSVWPEGQRLVCQGSSIESAVILRTGPELIHFGNPVSQQPVELRGLELGSSWS